METVELVRGFHDGFKLHPKGTILTFPLKAGRQTLEKPPASAKPLKVAGEEDDQIDLDFDDKED